VDKMKKRHCVIVMSKHVVVILILLGMSSIESSPDDSLEERRGESSSEAERLESPLFSGLVLESQESFPEVDLMALEEPFLTEKIPFYSDIRKVILQTERENISDWTNSK